MFTFYAARRWLLFWVVHAKWQQGGFTIDMPIARFLLRFRAEMLADNLTEFFNSIALKNASHLHTPGRTEGA
jgi:hypothetical protein